MFKCLNIIIFSFCILVSNHAYSTERKLSDYQKSQNEAKKKFSKKYNLENEIEQKDIEYFYNNLPDFDSKIRSLHAFTFDSIEQKNLVKIACWGIENRPDDYFNTFSAMHGSSSDASIPKCDGWVIDKVIPETKDFIKNLRLMENVEQEMFCGTINIARARVRADLRRIAIAKPIEEEKLLDEHENKYSRAQAKAINQFLEARKESEKYKELYFNYTKSKLLAKNLLAEFYTEKFNKNISLANQTANYHINALESSYLGYNSCTAYERFSEFGIKFDYP